MAAYHAEQPLLGSLALPMKNLTLSKGLHRLVTFGRYSLQIGCRLNPG